MDFLMEFIFTAILEGILGVTVKNPKVKIWVRTIIWLLIAEAIPVVIGVSAVSRYRSGDTSFGIAAMILSVVLIIGFLIGGIYGHKRKWEQ